MGPSHLAACAVMRLRFQPRGEGLVGGEGPGEPHFFASRFLYMPSMRWVTRKPPKMLTDAIVSARKPKTLASMLPSALRVTPTASSAPTTITEEMALVTDISGVCSAGVTLQTT